MKSFLFWFISFVLITVTGSVFDAPVLLNDLTELISSGSINLNEFYFYRFKSSVFTELTHFNAILYPLLSLTGAVQMPVLSFIFISLFISGSAFLYFRTAEDSHSVLTAWLLSAPLMLPATTLLTLLWSQFFLFETAHLYVKTAADGQRLHLPSELLRLAAALLFIPGVLLLFKTEKKVKKPLIILLMALAYSVILTGGEAPDLLTALPMLYYSRFLVRLEPFTGAVFTGLSTEIIVLSAAAFMLIVLQLSSRNIKGGIISFTALLLFVFYSRFESLFLLAFIFAGSRVLFSSKLITGGAALTAVTLCYLTVIQNNDRTYLDAALFTPPVLLSADDINGNSDLRYLRNAAYTEIRFADIKLLPEGLDSVNLVIEKENGRVEALFPEEVKNYVQTEKKYFASLRSELRNRYGGLFTMVSSGRIHPQKEQAPYSRAYLLLKEFRKASLVFMNR